MKWRQSGVVILSLKKGISHKGQIIEDEKTKKVSIIEMSL